MAWPTVSIDEVVNRIPKTLTSDELRVAEQRILDAADILQYQLRLRGVLEPPTEEPWAAQFIRIYTRVIADMVVRHISNHEGWVEQTVAIDDYRETFRRAGDTAPTHLYVDEGEVAQLLPPERQRRGRGSFSIVLGNS